MSTSTNTAKLQGRTHSGTRVLTEGYGPGAWHGADLKAALHDVAPALAFWRPAAGRHNIAEIALHHAYCTRGVRAQVSGQHPEPFILAGEDWFEAATEETLPWPTIRATVAAEHDKLHELISAIEETKTSSPLADEECFNLILGITCHAVYHAGQVQLIKRLRGD